MAATYDPQSVQCQIIYPVDQVKTAGDRLSVDVVALFVSGSDDSADKLPDFVFQDQRQIQETGENEPTRNVLAPSPISPDLEHGQPPSGSGTKAQSSTDKAEATRMSSYGKFYRAGRGPSTAERRKNWLTDDNGQLFRKAIQPLNLVRIIGVSIDLKRMFNLSFAQAAKEVGNALREHCIGRPMVFLCHGYAAFFLRDVLEADDGEVLHAAIAAIGMFGVNPKDNDISELKQWTAEKRSNISPQSVILKDRCQDDFGKALNNLRENHFVSVFAFRTDPQKEENAKKPEPMFYLSDTDQIWNGGNLDQIATFSGLQDAGFRGMCKYIVESVEGHQLLTAARENDHHMILTLIRRGTNIDGINYTNSNHKTALAIAAEAGHIETVNFLSTKDYVSLDHGVDREKSALHCAVKAINDLVDKFPQSDFDNSYDLIIQPAKELLSRLKTGVLPLDVEIQSLEETNVLNRQVKQLARTIKVVAILLEAGALPSGELVDTLKDQNPLAKAVKQLLVNPPAVQGPSPRQLISSTPSEQALEVCSNTPFVIREVFSIGKDGKDQYIPVYTNINQAIYQQRISTQSTRAGSRIGSLFDIQPPVASGSGETTTPKAGQPPAETARMTAKTSETSEEHKYSQDPDFDIDEDFRKRKESLNEAESRLICRWYHIPMNNMAWVHDLFARLDVHVWPWPQGYRDYKPRSRAVYPQFVKPKPLVASTTRSSLVVHAIMMSYLSYEQSYRTLITGILESRASGQSEEDEPVNTLEEMIRKFREDPRYGTRKETREDRWIKQLTKFSTHYFFKNHDGRLHFDFSDIYRHNQSDMDKNLETAVRQSPFAPQETALIDAYLDYKHYLGYKLPLHPRLRAKARERVPGTSDQNLFEEEDHNILMVDQLWIWLIEDDESNPKADTTQKKLTLVTSFPDRFGTKSAARNNIAQQVFRDSTRASFSNVSDLVRQIISVCLKTLNEARVDGSVSFLQCFEISLGNLEERSGQRFLEFRRLSEFLENLDEEHPDYLSRRTRLLKMLLRISKDSRILSEVKDVLDEIGIIQASPREETDRAPLYNELRRMIGNFERMKQRSQAVVDSIEKLLDLKQKHANLWEARTSREGSDEAAKGNKTLWWFTAVTIIFLPLSFMASFFALDIDKFPKDDDGDTNWPLNTVAGLLFGISLGFIIPLYTLALFSENLQRTWSRIRGIWLPLMELPVLWFLQGLPFMPWSLSRRFERRSSKNIRAVKKYDPKFEKIIERMMGENGTEVIKDNDLDEEDDLIREWRQYYTTRWGTYEMDEFMDFLHSIT